MNAFTLFKTTCRLSILLCFCSLLANGQKKVIISGDIASVKSGELYIVPLNIDRKYYGRNSLMDSSKIIDGKFKLIRTVREDYECAYRLLVVTDTTEGTTGMVFLGDKLETNIIVDTVNEYISPIIKNSVLQSELKYKYDIFTSALIKKIRVLDSSIIEIDNVYSNAIPESKMFFLENFRDQAIAESDSLLSVYSQNCPNSKVALWKLIERFGFLGYKSIYRNIANCFSNKIKNSSEFKILISEFNQAIPLSKGSFFPHFRVKGVNEETITIKLNKIKNKYTLVDFWFSSCSPCVNQFKSLNNTYSSYKDSGFEILGISVDSKRNTGRWMEAIKKNAIKWPQYLDEGGILAANLKITFFPTNYLLDSSAKIIEKNISPERLKVFLNYNLGMH